MRLAAAITEDREDSVLDPLRIGFIFAFLLMNGLEVYAVVWLGKEFNITEFGLANGTLLFGGASALWASSHQKDEPS